MHTAAQIWDARPALPAPSRHANILRRPVKSPKLYSYNVGLAINLLGIESAEQVAIHPARGWLFENLVVTESLKHRFDRVLQPNLSFFRDSCGARALSLPRDRARHMRGRDKGGLHRRTRLFHVGRTGCRIAAFVKERRGPEPDDSDRRKLDDVYYTCIQPILGCARFGLPTPVGGSVLPVH